MNLPVEFDEAKNVRWKIAIPDEGWSSPVVWGNEIWLTAGSDEKKRATRDLRRSEAAARFAKTSRSST